MKLPNLNFNIDQIKVKIKSIDQINDQINVKIKSIDQINDQINGEIKPIDQIKDNISDLGLEILKLIKEFPGIKVPELVIKLQNKSLIVNADKIRNEIKRHLYKYIEYKGSNKTGGYYLKHWFWIIKHKPMIILN